MNTPPSTTDVDNWVSGEQGLTNMLVQAVSNPGQPVIAFVAGYTRNDGTQGFLHLADPSQSPDAAIIVRGIVATYGAVIVRKYEQTYKEPPIIAFAAPAADQTAANDPAQWAS